MVGIPVLSFGMTVILSRDNWYFMAGITGILSGVTLILSGRQLVFYGRDTCYFMCLIPGILWLQTLLLEEASKLSWYTPMTLVLCRAHNTLISCDCCCAMLQILHGSRLQRGEAQRRRGGGSRPGCRAGHCNTMRHGFRNHLAPMCHLTSRLVQPKEAQAE